MKVLIVARGYNGAVSPIVANQAQSIQEEGIYTKICLIPPGGIKSYLKSIIDFRRKRKLFEAYDIIHAHYAFCGFVVSLAGYKNVVVSLMGSDVYQNALLRRVIGFFISYFWKGVIVKSEPMRSFLGDSKKVNVIPNGVDFEQFTPMENKVCRKKLALDLHKKYILFVANPDRKEKNYTLAMNAVNELEFNDVELLVVHHVDHSLIPIYLNATDVVLLTSHYEGSPNVIKEAMACNRPIVSTDVGDVREVVNRCAGTFVVKEPTVDSICRALNKSFEYKQTNGRDLISHLDKQLIAKRIIILYRSLL